ncbi:MAG: Hpt domain-containing protein [Desulfobacterales bacterium]|nr:Hpt domain-containing protein [Desulfobacterales bacterium]MBS3756061.1 Hpt domain-containing protein [Desulfobacterales bacterium]
MDINQLARALDMDPELYRELLALFIDNSQKELAELREALNRQDFTHAFRLSHSLKGAAVNLGLNGIAGQAESIETAAKTRDAITIDAIAGQLSCEVNELARLL